MKRDVTLFLSDPTAEAERLGQALRSEGYSAIDVPLAMLPARVAAGRPLGIVLDAQADGALEAVDRIRELPEAEGIFVILLGALEEQPEGTHLFVRPANVPEIVARVRTLVEESLLRPPTLPPPPSHPPSARPIPLATASTASLSAPPPPSFKLQEPPSPELSRLLAEAEEKIASLSHDAVPPTPEEEIDAVLPEEYLRSLDAPIDAVEEELNEGQGNQITTSGGANRGTTGGGRTNASERVPSTVGSYPIPGTQPPSGPPTAIALPSMGPPSVRSPDFLSERPNASSREKTAVARRSEPVAPLHTVLTHSERLAQPFVPAASGPSDRPIEEVDPRLAGTVLGPFDAARFLARAIGTRHSGALCFTSRAPEGLRRVLLRDGDLHLVTSGFEDESLVAFLIERGDLSRDRADLTFSLPPFGKRAVAPLIAKGLLVPDQMWNLLRLHAEWILGKILLLDRATVVEEVEVPKKMREEDPVFGGSTGAEVFVDVVRRTIAPEVALHLLGGQESRIHEGARRVLSSELRGPTSQLVERIIGHRVLRALSDDEAGASVVWALDLLGIVRVATNNEDAGVPSSPARVVDRVDDDENELDLDALKARIRARLDLVEEGDYFAVLGVSPSATSVEIRRAFLDLRRSFEPARILRPEIADLLPDVQKIVSVIEEAYSVLKDHGRRERYRRAIQSTPGS